jgi:hypothetical protein
MWHQVSLKLVQEVQRQGKVEGSNQQGVAKCTGPLKNWT